MYQTLHKPYIKLYIEPSKELYIEPSTERCTPPAQPLMLKFEKPFPLGRGWGRLPKIQQFGVIFQRFDINIFNFREHFPPPNFAYSAHNFSLPSPNLN